MSTREPQHVQYNILYGEGDTIHYNSIVLKTSIGVDTDFSILESMICSNEYQYG